MATGYPDAILLGLDPRSKEPPHGTYSLGPIIDATMLMENCVPSCRAWQQPAAA